MIRTEVHSGRILKRVHAKTLEEARRQAENVGKELCSAINEAEHWAWVMVEPYLVNIANKDS